MINYIQKDLTGNRHSFLGKIVIRFLVIKMISSYQFNIAKMLEQTFHNSYILIGKIRIIYRQKSESRDI